MFWSRNTARTTMGTSGQITPPRRRWRGGTGGALYGALKRLAAPPTRLTTEQDHTQPDEDQRPHGVPLDPVEDAGIGRQQQHTQYDEHHASGFRMVMAHPCGLDVALRTPPWVFTRCGRTGGRGLSGG